MDEVLKTYFAKGFSYQNIIQLLSKYHNTNISLRTLQQRLSNLGLKRRNIDYNREEVRQAILDHCNGPGSCNGYRSVWHTLQLKGVCVPRRVVAEILREVDPEGVVERRAKRLQRRAYVNPGPNFAWHADGYDKLKPYGFPIHGCIDGFSRRLIWLKVSRTNNNPSVVGGFFLEAVQHEGGCPAILRTDNGTENTVMASVQSYLRADGQDENAGMNVSVFIISWHTVLLAGDISPVITKSNLLILGTRAHIYGSSPSNQRIEGWWSYLRKAWSHWWINFFKDLIERGDLNTANVLESECLWFAFSSLLQKELNKVQHHWNTHYIRRSRHETLAGRPDELYYLPENVNAENHVHIVDNEKYQDMLSYCQDYQEDSMCQEYFTSIFTQMEFGQPDNWDEALTLYHNLMDIAR